MIDIDNEQGLMKALESIVDGLAEVRCALQEICNNIALLNKGKQYGDECIFQFPRVGKEKKWTHL